MVEGTQTKTVILKAKTVDDMTNLLVKIVDGLSKQTLETRKQMLDRLLSEEIIDGAQYAEYIAVGDLDRERVEIGSFTNSFADDLQSGERELEGQFFNANIGGNVLGALKSAFQSTGLRVDNSLNNKPETGPGSVAIGGGVGATSIHSVAVSAYDVHEALAKLTPGILRKAAITTLGTELAYMIPRYCKDKGIINYSQGNTQLKLVADGETVQDGNLTIRLISEESLKQQTAEPVTQVTGGKKLDRARENHARNLAEGRIGDGSSSQPGTRGFGM